MMWMCFLFLPLSVINWQLKIWSINWQRISPKRDPWLGVFRSTLEYLGVPKKHVVWNVDVAVYLSTTRNCREWLWLLFQSLKYHYAYVRFNEQHHDPIGDRPTSRVSAIIPSWKKCAPAVLNHSRKKKRKQCPVTNKHVGLYRFLSSFVTSQAVYWSVPLYWLGSAPLDAK